MTVRRNGTDTGTLKMRMGFLIRGQAQYREVLGAGHAGGGSFQPSSLAFAGTTMGCCEATTYATLSKNASSAASTASGVPTCIQTPPSRTPNNRSCSLARSNIFVSENSPAGASANSEGDMIAAPA